MGIRLLQGYVYTRLDLNGSGQKSDRIRLLFTSHRRHLLYQGFAEEASIHEINLLPNRILSPSHASENQIAFVDRLCREDLQCFSRKWESQ